MKVKYLSEHSDGKYVVFGTKDLVKIFEILSCEPPFQEKFRLNQIHASQSYHKYLSFNQLGKHVLGKKGRNVQRLSQGLLEFGLVKKVKTLFKIQNEEVTKALACINREKSPFAKFTQLQIGPYSKLLLICCLMLLIASTVFLIESGYILNIAYAIVSFWAEHV